MQQERAALEEGVRPAEAAARLREVRKAKQASARGCLRLIPFSEINAKFMPRPLKLKTSLLFTQSSQKGWDNVCCRCDW